jgi:hypothetical protein
LFYQTSGIALVNIYIFPPTHQRYSKREAHYGA